MKTIRTLKLFAVSVAVLGFIHLAPLSAKDVIESDAAGQAVWQEKELKFWFMGFNTYYSCDALERKLSSLLNDFGAKDDASVRASGCYAHPLNFSKRIALNLKFSVPVEVDSSMNYQNQNQNQTQDQHEHQYSKDTQVSKLVTEPAVFTASMQAVEVSRRSPKFLDSGDCELVEMFARHVLPSFTHEVTKPHRTCISGHSNGLRVQLKANVLKPLQLKNSNESELEGELESEVSKKVTAV